MGENISTPDIILDRYSPIINPVFSNISASITSGTNDNDQSGSRRGRVKIIFLIRNAPSPSPRIIIIRDNWFHLKAPRTRANSTDAPFKHVHHHHVYTWRAVSNVSYILETKLNSAVPLSLVVYFREGGECGEIRCDSARPGWVTIISCAAWLENHFLPVSFSFSSPFPFPLFCFLFVSREITGAVMWNNSMTSELVILGRRG